MEFKKNEQLIFRLILGSFCLSLIALLFFILSAPATQTADRRTWVSRLEDNNAPLLIGEPSGAASSEIVSAAPMREDIALPDAESSFFTVGFNPNIDGFSFQNYGTRFPQGDLTIDEVQGLFGNQVCVGGDGENCLPTPATHMWIDTMNSYMAAGHCAGFTVLSNRFYTDQVDQSIYTPNAEQTFEIEQSIPVMRQISKDWVLQVTEEVWSARVDGSPREVVDELLKIKEPVDLGIFGRNGGGHSLLAYGVEDKGDGYFHILVYDNNWPGEELFVEVDYRANTWRYSLAAGNPSEDAGAWEGDAQSKTLIFLPFDAYDQDVTCPFCPVDESTDEVAYNYITVSGDDVLLQVTSDEDERIGHFEDGFVNEVEDGRLVRLKDALYNDLEPYLGIPQTVNFTVRLVPRPEKEQAFTTLWGGGANLAFSLEGLEIKAGEEDLLTVEPGTQTINYIPGGERRPTLKLAVVQDGIPYLFTIGGGNMELGQSLNFGVDPETGELILSGNGIEDIGFALTAAQITPEGAAIFANESINVSAAGTTSFAFSEWEVPSVAESDSGTAPSSNGDTTADDETTAAESGDSTSDDGTTVAESGDSTSDDGTTVAESGDSTSDDGTIAAESGDSTSDDGTTVAESGDSTSDNGTTAAESGDSTSDDGTTVAENGDTTADGETTVAESGDTTSDDGTTAAESSDTTSDDGTTVAENGDTTADGGTTAAESGDTTSDDGTTVAENGNTTAEAGETTTADAGSATKVQGIEVNIDTDGDGVPDETFVAENQPITTVLQNFSTSEDIISLVDEIVPYMNQTQVDEFVETMTTSGLSGEVQGEILFDFVEFDLEPEEIAEMMSEQDLPADEMADLIFELKLLPTGQETLIEELDLSEEVAEEMAAELERLEKVDEVIRELEFLNLEGEEAVDFIDESGLDIEQIEELLEELGTTLIDITREEALPLFDDVDPTPTPSGANGSAEESETLEATEEPNVLATGSPTPVSGAVTPTGTVAAGTETATPAGTPLTETPSVTVTAIGTGTAGSPTPVVTPTDLASPTIVLTPTSTRWPTVTPVPTATPVPPTATPVPPAPTPAPPRPTTPPTATSEPNLAPVAVDDQATVPSETLTTIPVTANDSDPNGDSLSITVIGSPQNGVVAVFGTSINYLSNSGYAGSDSFTYTITDGSLTASATVFVQVNGPPVAVNDSATVSQGSTTTIQVLANDINPSGGTLSITSAGPASNGSATVGSGGVVYTPNAGFRGTDSFNYTISNGVATASATVTVLVNGTPIAQPDSVTVVQGGTVTINVLANDSDPDGDALTLTAFSPAGNGAVSIVGGQIQYTPNATFFGIDSFSYSVSDGLQTVQGSVTVTVNNVNDAPAASNDSATTNEDTAVTISVLSNDSDPDGDPLTITGVGGAGNGSAVVSGNDIVYTPNANYSGLDSFTYTISDGALTANATVNIVVNAVSDDPPVGVDDSGTTTINTSVNIEVLANDFDPDNDSISIASVNPGTNGTTSFLTGGTTVLYIPNAGFTGTDSFTYTITDGSFTGTATVTVTVNP